MKPYRGNPINYRNYIIKRVKSKYGYEFGEDLIICDKKGNEIERTDNFSRGCLTEMKHYIDMIIKEENRNDKKRIIY